MKEVSLVLSGGSVKGVAHIGLLAAMRDHGVTVKSISGTSAGALVGALYANGLTIEDMLEFFKSSSLFNVFNVAIWKPGVFDTSKYHKVIEKVLPQSFEALKIPLYISAVNLNTAEVKYFSEGPLIRPLLASCAVPFLFSPIKIEDNLYVDGGVGDNFPIDPLLIYDHGLIWGSYINKPFPESNDELNSTFKATVRTSSLLMFHGNKAKFIATDYMFMPNMSKVNAFDTSHVDKAFHIGYAYAKNELEKMEKVEKLAAKQR
jgi:NTE family protein